MARALVYNRPIDTVLTNVAFYTNYAECKMKMKQEPLDPDDLSAISNPDPTFESRSLDSEDPRFCQPNGNFESEVSRDQSSDKENDRVEPISTKELENIKSKHNERTRKSPIILEDPRSSQSNENLESEISRDLLSKKESESVEPASREKPTDTRLNYDETTRKRSVLDQPEGQELYQLKRRKRNPVMVSNTRSELKRAATVTHEQPPVVPKKRNKIDSTTCRVCLTRLRSLVALQRHSVYYSKPLQYSCSKCHAFFNSNIVLVKHMDACVRNKINIKNTCRYVCNFCKRKFSQKNFLQSHLFHCHPELIYPPADGTEPTPEEAKENAVDKVTEVSTIITSNTEVSTPKRMRQTTLAGFITTINTKQQKGCETPRKSPGTSKRKISRTPTLNRVHVKSPRSSKIPTQVRSIGSYMTRKPFVQIHINSDTMMALLDQTIKTEPEDFAFGENSMQNIPSDFTKMNQEVERSPRRPITRRRKESLMKINDEQLRVKFKCKKCIVHLNRIDEVLKILLPRTDVLEDYVQQQKKVDGSRQIEDKELCSKDASRKVDEKRLGIKKTLQKLVGISFRIREPLEEVVEMSLKNNELPKNKEGSLMDEDSTRNDEDIIVRSKELSERNEEENGRSEESCKEIEGKSVKSDVVIKSAKIPLVRVNYLVKPLICTPETVEIKSEPITKTIEDESFVCKVCNKCLSSQENLREHTELFHVAYISSICSARYTTLNKLLHHYLRQHMAIKRTTCCVCYEKIKPAKITQHLSLHCLKILQSYKDNVPVDNDTDCSVFMKRHRCRACGKRFWLKSCLKQHQVVCSRNRSAIKMKQSKTDSLESEISKNGPRPKANSPRKNSPEKERSMIPGSKVSGPKKHSREKESSMTSGVKVSGPRKNSSSKELSMTSGVKVGSPRKNSPSKEHSMTSGVKVISPRKNSPSKEHSMTSGVKVSSPRKNSPSKEHSMTSGVKVSSPRKNSPSKEHSMTSDVKVSSPRKNSPSKEHSMTSDVKVSSPKKNSPSKEPPMNPNSKTGSPKTDLAMETSWSLFSQEIPSEKSPSENSASPKTLNLRKFRFFKHSHPNDSSSIEPSYHISLLRPIAPRPPVDSCPTDSSSIEPSYQTSLLRPIAPRPPVDSCPTYSSSIEPSYQTSLLRPIAPRPPVDSCPTNSSSIEPSCQFSLPSSADAHPSVPLKKTEDVMASIESELQVIFNQPVHQEATDSLDQEVNSSSNSVAWSELTNVSAPTLDALPSLAPMKATSSRTSGNQRRPIGGVTCVKGYQVHVTGSDRAKFPCNICGTQFHTFQNLCIHERTFCRAANDRCGACGTAFTSKRLLQMHVAATHSLSSGLNYKFFCQYCKQGFTKKTSVQIHERHFHTDQSVIVLDESLNNEAMWSINTVCTVCNLLFESYDRFIEHNMYYYKGQLFTCTFCGQTFEGLFMLNHHNKLVHYPQGTKKSYSYLCEICGEGFNHESHFHAHRLHLHLNEPSTQASLLTIQEHNYALESNSSVCVDMKQQVPIKAYICDICNLNFTSQQDLTMHETEYSSDGDFQCNKCDKKYRTAAVLTKHQSLNHSSSNISSSYKCSSCGEVLTTNTSMMCHEKHFHGSNENRMVQLKNNGVSPSDPRKSSVDQSNIQDVSCLTCSMKFENELNLKEHLLEYSDIGTFLCNICHRRFAELYRLEMHKVKHTRLNHMLSEHHCPICLEGVTSATNVKSHVLHLHGYEAFPSILKQVVKPIKSPNLPETQNTSVQSNAPNSVAAEKDSLRSTASTSSSVKSCSACNQVFGNVKSLSRHRLKRSPSGEYVCSICNLGLPWLPDFIKHLYQHSDSINKQCRSCTRCTIGFSRPIDVWIHILRIHGRITDQNTEGCLSDEDCAVDSANNNSNQEFLSDDRISDQNTEKCLDDENHIVDSANKNSNNDPPNDDRVGNQNIEEYLDDDVRFVDSSNDTANKEPLNDGDSEGPTVSTESRKDKDDVDVTSSLNESPDDQTQSSSRISNDNVGAVKGSESADKYVLRFVCPVCYLKYPTPEKFRMHFRMTHLKMIQQLVYSSDRNSTITCVFCKVAFSDRNKFVEHMRDDHGTCLRDSQSGSKDATSSETDSEDEVEVIWEKIADGAQATQKSEPTSPATVRLCVQVVPGCPKSPAAEGTATATDKLDNATQNHIVEDVATQNDEVEDAVTQNVKVEDAVTQNVNVESRQVETVITQDDNIGKLKVKQFARLGNFVCMLE